MSNLLNYQTIKNKEENKNQLEKDSLYHIDIQLLSSLKSIPGKIIPLENKFGQMTNNKENSQDINKKDTFNNILKKDSINNNFSYNNEKIDMNNNSLYKNNFGTNNYFFNGGINNTNLNINSYNNFQKRSSVIIQNPSPTLDNQMLFSYSNHPSILSFKSDLKNNNILWSDIKFTQNSFTHNIFLYNNENNNSKGNINNSINNNSKNSQLSYQFSNYINDDLLKKKKSTTNLLRKNSNNSFGSSENNNKRINQVNNFNLEKSKINIINNQNKIEENIIINIKEEEKQDDNISMGKNKNKKIFFNIEKFCEEEDDSIYPNINNNKNESNNLFNCYLKKKKKRKIINEVYKFKCCHPKCDCSYKTNKQLQSHHFKMTPECQQDSVEIIRLIHDTKNILKNIIKHSKKKKEKYEKLYDNFVNKISLKNYFEFIAGSRFNDDV